MNKKALILDRDGIINIDRHFVCKKEQVEFVDGIFELCRAAYQKSYFLIVTTNQSGIGRGYFSEDDFQILMNWLSEIFASEKCPLDRIYYCPYHPIYGIGNYCRESDLRKPNPGMILQAAKDFNLDLSKSISIGDKITDIQAAAAAKIGANFLYSSLLDPIPSQYNCKIIRHLADVEAYL